MNQMLWCYQFPRILLKIDWKNIKRDRTDLCRRNNVEDMKEDTNETSITTQERIKYVREYFQFK